MRTDTHLRTKSYLLWTFAITWICWGTVAVANRFGALSFGTPSAMILFLIGGNGPPIVAYFLLKRWGEIDGFRAYVKRFFAFSRPGKHYVLVLGFLLLHFIIPLAMGASNQTMAFYMGFLYIPMNFFGGGLEEIGWRGILQPELEKGLPFLPATALVALIWALWHLPLWFIAGTYQTTIGFGLFAVSVFGLAFALAAIRMVTKSVFLCILFHTCVNSFMAVFMMEQGLNSVAVVIAEIGASILLVSWWKKRRISRQAQIS